MSYVIKMQFAHMMCTNCLSISLIAYHADIE